MAGGEAMKAIEIVCSSYEWWGNRWQDANPYSFDFRTIHDSHGLANAPIVLTLLNPDPLETAQLLRILADKLEREPQLLAPLNEPGSNPENPLPGGYGPDDCPF